jgi:large repetitive protein
MKFKKYLLICVFILLNHYVSFAQLVTPFAPRLPGGNISIKGDLILVGNNILNKTQTDPTGFDANGEPLNLDVLTAEANTPFNAGGTNNGQNLEYIDIDGDTRTFSSSRADLAIGTNPDGTVDDQLRLCKKIVYAGLYWTASYPFERYQGPDLLDGTNIKNDWNQIKFRLPGGNYIDIVADNAADPVNDEDAIIVSPTRTPFVYNRPYVCYKNVTTLLQSLADPNGEYFVANQRASRGRNPNGNSGGWSLVVIYESPTVTSKYISTFDGFANVSGSTQVDFNINGFRTIPFGTVRSKIGVSALEGDTSLRGESLQFKANTLPTFTPVFNGINPANNFFNGTISNDNFFSNNRLPNSRNTFGFDLDRVTLNNNLNLVLPNNETGATIRLSTAGDAFGAYLTTFAVDVIAPDIQLTKQVKDLNNVSIEGQEVKLCEDLLYVVGFKNIGNDDAVNLVIKDVLPINITFNPATDLTLPLGVTLASYIPGIRELTFNVDNDLVVMNGPRYEIVIKVKVVCNCIDLDDACANQIKNQAFATYTGTTNTNTFSNEGSIASFGNCNIGNPTSTNFLVGIDPAACSFTREVILCGNTVQLTAANGYTNYQWTGPPGAIFLPNANSQTVTVNLPGTYTVNNTINQAPCKDIRETINVVNFNGGAGLNNPIIPYNENLPATVCPNNGVVVPFIFLCGAADTQLLATNVTGSLSVVWEKLNPACLTTSAPGSQGDITSTLWNPLCPREGLPNTCWIPQLSVGGNPNNFLANAPGEYRVTYTFQGNCTKTFYFNVYQNLLNPTFVKKDIVCNSLGEITIENVPVTTPASYNYTLIPGNTTSPNPNTTGVFVGIPAGVYEVVVTQIGVVDGCKFTLPPIPIINRNASVESTVVDALCFEDKGTITLIINNANPQYNFSLFNAAGTLINNSGLIDQNTYTFPAQSPGNYTYTVTSSAPDSCNLTGTAEIKSTPQLFVNASITKPILPCSQGEITFNATGGTPTYTYTVNGVSVVSNTFDVASPGGNYEICALDFNDCKACTRISIAPNPPPVFTVTQTNILCAGTNSGAININVTNANGFQILTSINGGTPLNVFNYTNLPAGTYQVALQYGLNGVFCTTPAQAITITEPSNPLTASGGVSQVACLSNGGNGTIRITNPQGGTPPYQYNLGLGYGTVNQRDVPPGMYDISIRDANGCEFFMKVTVAPIPTAPTITVGPPVYACDGSASTSVTVLNPAGTNYTYQYLIDTPLTPPHDPNSNVFTNIPCGPRVITVSSTLVSPPTFSELLKEDFGRGPDTTSPGIAAAYCFNNQPYPPGQPCGNNPIPGFPRPNCRERGNDSWYLDDNQYVVTSDLNPNNCNWFDYRDHTSNGTDRAGRFLAVNIGFAAGPNGVLYSKVINSVIPNQPLQIELYLANLLKKGVGGVDPDFLIEIVAPNGTVLGRQLVGVIDNQDDVWQLKTLSLNPGNNTTLTFNIRSGSTQYNGNDAAIDDIRVYQLPLSCTNSSPFPINIPCDQAFNAQIVGSTQPTCAGANDATVTLSVANFNTTTGYQISLNNGINWDPYFVSPTTITLPVGYPGFVLVRYDATTPPNPKCNFSLPFVIIQPTAINVTATPIDTSCITGGTITANATGGTGAYQYQLEIVPGGAALYPFQSSNIFNNVPIGTYNVVVRDINLCLGTTPAPVEIKAPAVPVVTIASASCLTATTNATIVVNATGGTAPYTYFIDGNVNTPPGSNTFTNVGVGSHVIYVIDANGCRSASVEQIIAPLLVTTGSILKPLDCTASPNAIIQGAITGGLAPFSYTVNGGTTSFPITGTFFTYSAVAGTFTFTVTDALGCTSSFTQRIDPITNPTVTVTPGPIIDCAGDSTGSLNVVLGAGGLPPYTIVVARTTPNPQIYNGNGPLFDGLPAGNYTVTVTDANSCQAIQNVTITEKPAIAFTPIKKNTECNDTLGFLLGSIETGPITGGTPPYRVFLTSSTNVIALPSPQTSPTGGSILFDPLNAGTYEIRVVDANNCETTVNNLSIAPPPQTLIINTSATATCADGATIVVSLVPPSGSVGPFSFGIYNGTTIAPFTNALVPAGGISPPAPLQYTFTNLVPGVEYTFVVYDDDTKCYYTQKGSSVAPATTIAATVSNVNCVATPGNANPIQITVTNFGGGTAVQYEIFNSANNITTGVVGTITTATPISGIISTLPLGSYYVVLTQIGGVNDTCKISLPVFTTTPAPLRPLSLRLVSNVNANCNQPNSIVTVQANGGGGAPYSYIAVISGTTPAPTTGFLPSNVLSLNPLVSTTWDIYVQDATGCTTSIAVTIASDPLPTVTPGVVDQCISNGSYSFTVTGTGVAPLTYAIYSINGTLVTPQVFQSNNFVVNTPGTYVIIVKDKNGCTAQSTQIVIAPPIVATASFTTLPTCNVANGTITVTASGGSGATNFTYALLPGAPQTNNIFNNVAPGNYVIIVTDTQTNCAKRVDVNLSPATDPVFSLLPTSTACIGDRNGTITVNLTPPPANVDFDYTYTITAGPATFVTPVTLPVGTNVFTGLPTGNYTVEVVSARGCRLPQTVRVDEPAPIFIPTPTVVPFNCTTGSNITNLASITVNGVTGGNGGPYTYQFFLGGAPQPNNGNVLNVTNLAGGTYTINVKDNKGCIYPTTAVIDPFTRISDPVVAVTAPITCTTPESIAVTVTINGPVVALNYTISPIAPTPPLNQTNNTGVFTGLVVGSYNIEISNPATGCSLNVVHNVSDPNTFNLTVAKVTDVLCKGGNDGSVNLTISDTLPPDQSGPFGYTLTNNSVTPPLVITGTSPTAGPTLVTGLTAGTYTASVTLTNDPFCTSTSNFTIIEPGVPLSVVTTSTEITCITQGTITAVATGGWQGVYQYQLLLNGNAVGGGFSPTNVFTGLIPGSYTVQVRDINGCIAVSNPPIVLVVPAPITATITPTPIDCKDDTTTLTISNITGGQGSNYSYILSGPIPANISGPQSITSNPFSINGLIAGTYSIDIIDGWGCKNTFPINITEPAKVVATLTTRTSPTCTTGAILTLTASGGTSPYTYSAAITGSFNPPTFNPSTDITLAVNATGSFSYYVRDAQGCISLVSNTVRVEPVKPTRIKTLTKQDIKCGGDVTGQINVVAEDGLGNYQYTLLNAAGGVILGPQDTGLFTGLATGTYFVQVTGDGGCRITTPAILITEPPVFRVTLTPNPVKCFGGRDGSITINTTNGVGQIIYGIDPPNIGASVVISNPANTPTTLNPPITYTIQDLQAGTYQVLVQDQNGCFYRETIIINEPTTAVSGQVNDTDILDELCFGDNNGQFTVTNIGGGAGGPFTISLYLDSLNNTPLVADAPINNSAGANTHIFTLLGGGNYIVVIKDANACRKDLEVTIKDGIDMDPKAILTYPCVDNKPSVKIEVVNNSSADGSFDPIGDYTFVLTQIGPPLVVSPPQIGNNVFTSQTHPQLLTPGGFSVTVTNVNTCEKVSDVVTVTADNLLPLTLTLDQGGLNQIVATATGGSGGYTYTFNGEYTGSDNVYVYYFSGVYTVVVTDSSGCTAEAKKEFIFIPIVIPDFFTPNGDGTNSTWTPLNTSNYKNLKTFVYDRYGRKLREMNEGEKWDGTYEGKEVPSGDYWYVVKVNDPKNDQEFVGHFTLYR